MGLQKRFRYLSRPMMALGLAWLFYVLLNGFFTSTFVHLKAFPAFTVADIVRIERIASGVDQPRDVTNKMPSNPGVSEYQMAILPYSAEDVVKLGPKPKVLIDLHQLISREFVSRDLKVSLQISKPATETVKPVAADDTKTKAAATPATPLAGAGAATNPAPAVPTVPAIVTTKVEEVHPLYEHLLILTQALKLRCAGEGVPQEKVTDLLTKICMRDHLYQLESQDQQFRDDLDVLFRELPTGLVKGQFDDAQMLRYRRLLGRVETVGKNTHLLNEAFQTPQNPEINTFLNVEPPPTSTAFTILCAPTGKENFWLGLEISREERSFSPPGSCGGYALVARYFLIDIQRGTLFQSARTRSQPVLTRQGEWWTGLRPTAVLVSENQLASRFFSEMATLKDGCLISEEILPPKKEQVHLQEYIAAVLRERLGRDSVPAGQSIVQGTGQIDKSILDHHPRSMESWIEWPRRFNGGTWWGMIQFTIITLFFWFVLEWVGLTYGSARENELTSLANRRHLRRVTSAEQIEYFLNDARAALEDRSWFIWYLSAALPLLGFFGTVVGLSISLVGASGVSADAISERQAALQAMTVALGTAFDKSFFAFLLSIFTTLGCYAMSHQNQQMITRYLDRRFSGDAQSEEQIPSADGPLSSDNLPAGVAR